MNGEDFISKDFGVFFMQHNIESMHWTSGVYNLNYCCNDKAYT